MPLALPLVNIIWMFLQELKLVSQIVCLALIIFYTIKSGILITTTLQISHCKTEFHFLTNGVLIDHQAKTFHLPEDMLMKIAGAESYNGLLSFAAAINFMGNRFIRIAQN